MGLLPEGRPGGTPRAYGCAWDARAKLIDLDWWGATGVQLASAGRVQREVPHPCNPGCNEEVQRGCHTPSDL
ncbi:hypothetical protein GCM10023075_10780 [Streptosporangium album]